MISYILLCAIFIQGLCSGQVCPDQDPSLTPWSPGDSPEEDVTISGEALLLEGSATLRTITITGGGRLVIRDNIDAILRVSYILIQGGGALIIGSEECPYVGNFTISLFGRNDDDTPSQAAFGRKFIGVAPTGTLEIHGPRRTSWTTLIGDLEAGSQDANNATVITVFASVSDWLPGDRIVIASTDYSMDQAEVFDIVECEDCREGEVKIMGEVQYLHTGRVINGADMSAEVALLSRNLVIRGEMEPACYGDNFCDYFDYDTYGGHIQVLVSFTNVHIEGAELVNMGQQELGNYPVHFHRTYDVDEVGGYDTPAYVRDLSIHQSFSRCVTIHSTNGLVVEDVVGYNVLGHCFFLEDGNEERNIFRRNLGLVTKPGMLLPSDRDANMCETFLDDVEGDYIPDADRECRGVSTFWIAHPNNFFEDNVAAGSEEIGFFFVFHREPTGPSAGLLPPFHGERSPLGSFTRNKAHSNRRVALLLDRGVKIDNADENDPREFLALADHARFMPHEDQDILGPRVPAVLSQTTLYKNSGIGAFVRGGDVYITDSIFVDNGVGVIMASEQTLPHDAGSHQEVRDCTFVGQSDNLGSNGGGNRFWGQGHDGIDRSLPQDDSVPIRGVLLYDGPVEIVDSSFERYVPDSMANHSAISFTLQNQGQSSPANTIRNVDFDEQSLPISFPDLDGEFDGDLTQIVYDPSGSVSGQEGAYMVRATNYLARDEACTETEDGQAVICTGLEYGQLSLTTSTKDLSLTLTHQDNEDEPLTLRGAVRDNPDFPDTNVFMPVVIVGDEYSAIYEEGETPENVTVTSYNFEQNAEVLLSITYPSGSEPVVRYDEWDQMRDEATAEEDLVAGDSVDDVTEDSTGKTYYWDVQIGVLTIKVLNRYPVEGYNYCSIQGCQRIHIAV